jgi:hypothetical protein
MSILLQDFPVRLQLSDLPTGVLKAACSAGHEQCWYQGYITGIKHYHHSIEVELIREVDKQWSFVGSKKKQRWWWSAWEPRLK